MSLLTVALVCSGQLWGVGQPLVSSSVLGDVFEALSKCLTHQLPTSLPPSRAWETAGTWASCLKYSISAIFNSAIRSLARSPCECISCSHSVQTVRSTQYLVLSTLRFSPPPPPKHSPLHVIDNLVRAERGHYQLAHSGDSEVSEDCEDSSRSSPGEQSQGNAKKKDDRNCHRVCRGE